jgi:hypothetical protein
MSNNRLEFARVARPTRNGDAPLLAAQPERWAVMWTITLVLVAMTLGAVGAMLIPSEFVLIPILVPFVLCIFLGWYVAFQNKAVQLTPFRLFLWPWVNVTASLRASRALQALYACAALVAGACLGLLVLVANA